MRCGVLVMAGWLMISGMVSAESCDGFEGQEGMFAHGLYRPAEPVSSKQGCESHCCDKVDCTVWQWRQGHGRYDGCWLGDWSRLATAVETEKRPGWSFASSLSKAARVEQTYHGVETRGSQSSFCDADGWESVWEEDFEGNTLDETAWNYDLGGGDSSVRDSQGTRQNVQVINGSLVIVSKRQTMGKYNYTSGAINTGGKKSWSGHTRVCVSAKLPGGGGGAAGVGVWPAHWMMPETHKCWPTSGEIDIMEMVNGDGTLHGTYHWSATNECNKDTNSGGHIQLPWDWGSAFHEYSVEYSAKHIAFAVDGVVYHNVSSQAMLFDVPYHVILNTAVGGPWPMPPNASTVFPTYHFIDYVHVSQPETTAAPTAFDSPTPPTTTHERRPLHPRHYAGRETLLRV